MLVLTSCTTSVDPILGTERPFTLWGILNPKTNIHTVRVFEIEDRLRLLSPDPLDVSIISIHQQTGTRHVWRDSVVQLADGDYRHVFWAQFPTTAGDVYHVEAQGLEGERAFATPVTIPPLVTIERQPAPLDQTNPILLPVTVDGIPPQVPRIDVEYFARTFSPSDDSVPILNSVLIAYEGTLLETEGGRLLNIDLSRDFVSIQRNFFLKGLPFDFIQLDSLEVRFHVGDQNWVSDVGTFDADVLVEPGTFSNIGNGFGFVGSGYMERLTWRPPTELLQRAGFTLP